MMKNNFIKCGMVLTGLMVMASAGASEISDCIIEPSATIEVTTAEMGVLQAVYVERGEFVKEGQPLAILNAEVEKANYDLAQIRANSSTTGELANTRLMYLTRKVARSEELHKKAFLSTDEKDDVETERAIAALKLEEARDESKIAKADLRRAQAVLDQRVITSPISGVVTKRHLSAGEFAQTKPILDLVKVNPLNVELMVPLSMYGKFKKGMTVNISPEAPISGSYPAKVIIADPVIDGASGTFGVRLELPNKMNKIPAGIECVARI